MQGGGKGLPGGRQMSKHRGKRGPEVVRHRQEVDKAERSSLIAALLVLAAFCGLLGWILLNTKAGTGAGTP